MNTVVVRVIGRIVICRILLIGYTVVVCVVVGRFERIDDAVTVSICGAFSAVVFTVAVRISIQRICTVSRFISIRYTVVIIVSIDVIRGAVTVGISTNTVRIEWICTCRNFSLVVNTIVVRVVGWVVVGSVQFIRNAVVICVIVCRFERINDAITISICSAFNAIIFTVAIGVSIQWISAVRRLISIRNAVIVIISVERICNAIAVASKPSAVVT